MKKRILILLLCIFIVGMLSTTAAAATAASCHDLQVTDILYEYETLSSMTFEFSATGYPAGSKYFAAVVRCRGEVEKSQVKGITMLDANSAAITQALNAADGRRITVGGGFLDSDSNDEGISLSANNELTLDFSYTDDVWQRNVNDIDENYLFVLWVCTPGEKMQLALSPDWRPLVMRTVTAAAGAGGSIAPAGEVAVPFGSGKTFTFLPNACHEIDQVLLDGEPVSFSGNSYHIEEVFENHTIEVSFKPVATSDAYHNVKITSGTHGALSPSGGDLRVQHGYPLVVYLYPADGYKLDQLTVDGVAMNIIGNSFTVPAITKACQIHAAFTEGETPQIKGVTIAASAGTNGSISPMGDVTVESGGDMYYYFIPNAGYVVDEVTVTVAGVEEKVSGSFYHFSNVTGDSSIHVSFKTENQADVDKAQAAIQGRNWTVPQGVAGTKAALLAWIESQLDEMDLQGASYTAHITDFTAAIAGTRANRNGTKGSYSFSVSLSKGAATATATVPNGVITPRAASSSGDSSSTYPITVSDTQGAL